MIKTLDKKLKKMYFDMSYSSANQRKTRDNKSSWYNRLKGTTMTTEPISVFVLTEDMADLILGSGTTRRSKYLPAILECARQTSSFFRDGDFIFALTFTEWQKRDGGGLVANFDGGGRIINGRPFTVRYIPQVNQRHLCIAFFNERGNTGLLLPLGGVLSPDTLMELEDELSTLAEIPVVIPILAQPIWTPEPWGKTTVEMVWRPKEKMYLNGVPLRLDKNSPTPPNTKAVFTIVDEDKFGAVLICGRPTKAIVRRPEFRTNERIPAGFKAVEVLGINLDTATEDDIVQAAQTMITNGPTAEDSVCQELERLERKLDLTKPEDAALWRKAIFVARKMAMEAMRAKFKAEKPHGNKAEDAKPATEAPADLDADPPEEPADGTTEGDETAAAS